MYFDSNPSFSLEENKDNRNKIISATMFKTSRKYSGLDDLFGTSSKSERTGWPAMQKRIDELDTLSQDWDYNLWAFTQDNEECQYLINEVREAIDILESAYSEYIIGEYNSSIIASSAALERAGNVPLYLGFVNSKPKIHPTVEQDWISIHTVNGIRYYDSKWNKVIQVSKGYIIYPHGTLSATMLHNLENLGYSCNCLLNQGDTLDNCIFISRRNAAAHGDFSRILIIEQLHGQVAKDINRLLSLTTNKDACFDQYKKAYMFILGALTKFNNLYPPPRK